jgi:DNA-binding response OmpR family regulator
MLRRNSLSADRRPAVHLIGTNDDAQPIKVLLVEHDAAMQTTSSGPLGWRGMHAAACGESALAPERWRTSSPDVVVLDLGAPGLDGSQVPDQSLDGSGLGSPSATDSATRARRARHPAEPRAFGLHPELRLPDRASPGRPGSLAARCEARKHPRMALHRSLLCSDGGLTAGAHHELDQRPSPRAPNGRGVLLLISNSSAMTSRVLLVDDDARLSAMVGDYLRSGGFDVDAVGTLAAGRERLSAQGYDALVLDLMLPDGDGLDLCRELRHQARTRHLPLLMLTARGEPLDRIVGLELGADDYLPKPFEPRELLARVKALLRRAAPTPNDDEVLRFGRLEIDLGARIARLDGQPCDLTSHQFDLLVVLAQSPGRVLSRDQIMDALKGHPLEAFDRSIDVHISRIRAVIEDDPKMPRRVLTVRGAGYVFAKKQDADS